MTDRQKSNLTGFARTYDDQMSERFDRIFGVGRKETPQDSPVDDLFGRIDTAIHPDLTGYVPSFRDVFEWAEDSLPDDYYFETEQDRFDAALENFKRFPMYPDDIPQELLDWAEQRDWDKFDAMEWIRTCPVHEKSANFIAIVMGLRTQMIGAFEGSIENIINEEEPENGSTWHAAMAMYAIRDSVQQGFAFCDDIERFLGSIENYSEEVLATTAPT